MKLKGQSIQAFLTEFQVLTNNEVHRDNIGISGKNPFYLKKSCGLKGGDTLSILREERTNLTNNIVLVDMVYDVRVYDDFSVMCCLNEDKSSLGGKDLC